MAYVLIVDDRSSFRRELRRLLAHAGLSVVGEAGNIREAEALVQYLQPDLVVVDVMLPGLTGLEGTPCLKAIAPDLRVILVSTHCDQADVFHKAAEEVGAEAFIVKDDLDLEVVHTWEK
jgi:DNA-binding NarL/FixJ family response regulator